MWNSKNRKVLATELHIIMPQIMFGKILIFEMENTEIYIVPDADGIRILW